MAESKLKDDNHTRDALSKVSRPIQLDVCIWGRAEVWTWGARAVSTSTNDGGNLTMPTILRDTRGGCQETPRE
jgi:hypothetical protein